jgi:hypothetical protein
VRKHRQAFLVAEYNPSMAVQTTVDADADLLFEMANLNPKKTGLPFVVWISPRGNARHDVQIKVSAGPRAVPSEMATVAIRPEVCIIEGFLNPTDIQLLRQWIELNQEVLIRFWDGDIAYTDEVLEQLRSI